MILSTLEDGKIVKTALASVDFALECDILCMGAGSAGIYASATAAREGARVILCELAENIGGTHACGHVTGYYLGAHGGIYEEDRKKEMADSFFYAKGAHWEVKQIHVLERLKESGVTLLCRHSATGVYFEGDRVVGLRVFNGERELNIRATLTIDATADGHLLRMTDVKKRYGKPTDGTYVPFTVRTQYVDQNGILRSDNRDAGEMNHYDAWDFSKKTLFAHAKAEELFERGEFVSHALHVGVREGLAFEGEEPLSYRNVLLENTPKKILFYAYSDLDRHGCERATDEEFFQNWWVVANLSTVTVNIPVPMGCIVPRDMKGLISAGRCLSCDTYIQSAVRMNRDMFRMGECIGVAAAMAVKSHTDFLDIDYEEYLRHVQARACFAGHADRTFGFDDPYYRYFTKTASVDRKPDPRYAHLPPCTRVYTPISFDAEENFHFLKTDTPGRAIWSCFVAPDQAHIKEKLDRAMTEAEDALTRFNCAIALGITGDMRALPVLREITRNRDCFFFCDNRRSNQFRSAVAVCLLGRLGTKEDLPLLYELLGEREIERDMYHTLEADYLYHELPDRNFVYFAMFTHACMALYKIYRRCALPMRELHAYFEKLFSDEQTVRRLTHQKEGELAYDECKKFMQCVLKITSPD